MRARLLGWKETWGDPHLLSVHRLSAASPETSALQGLRSPEEERKQDAYQERLFLFFVTNPLTWGWGELILKGLPWPGCCCLQPPALGPTQPYPPPWLLLLGRSLHFTEPQDSHL